MGSPFKVFGIKCYIKRGDDDFGKFDSRTDECIFLGYSSKTKAYRNCNLRLNFFVETANVGVNDSRSKMSNYKQMDNHK